MRRLTLALVVLTCAAAFAGDVPPEIRALDADDRAVVADALRENPEGGSLVAGVLRDGEAFDTLTPEARLTLVTVAGSLSASRLNSGLRRVVRDETQPGAIRRAAVKSLGAVGGIADVAALEGVLGTYPAEAARALGTIGGRSAELALRKHADDGEPAILAALARSGDGDALESLVLELDAPEAAGHVGELLTWATGREGPWTRSSANAHLRRRALAMQLAIEDVTTAQTVVQELSAVLASGTSTKLETDLVAILRDALWPAEARSHAALVLGRGHAGGAVDDLLWACRNLEDGPVRLYAAEALALVGDLRIAVPFADLLVHDEDRDRIKARRTSTGEYFPVDPGLARALFRLGCAGAVEPLLEVLEGKYRTRMHRDTLRAFREFSGGEDFAYEADSSQSQRDAASKRVRAWWAEARDEAAMAPDAEDPGWGAFRAHVAGHIELLGTFKFLHQLRAKKALVIVAEPAMPQLVAALRHEDLHVRMGAAEVLTISRLRAPAAAIVEALGTEENAAARTKLIDALEVCGRPRAGAAPEAAYGDAVRPLLRDRSIDVRIAATRALGTLGDLVRDREALRTYSGHAIETLRVAAAGSLLILGDTTGLDVLLDELLSDDVARRAAAANVLRRAGVDLTGYDPDASPEQREAAVDQVRSVSRETR